MSEDILEFIPTKGSKLNKKAENDFKVVTFESHKPKKKKRLVETEETTNEIVSNELNMKRAKFEIIKFGMSGFDPEKKEEAKVQLAIKLGAKPPKNKYKNYKQLLEERKKDKESEKARVELQQLGKNNLGKSNAKGKSYDRKRRKEKGILDIYGTVKAPHKTGIKK